MEEVNKVNPRSASREQMLEMLLDTLLSDPAIVKIADSHQYGFTSWARKLLETPRMDHNNYKLLSVDAMVDWAMVHGGPGFTTAMEKVPGVVRAGLSSGALLMMTHIYAEFSNQPNVVLNPDDRAEYQIAGWVRAQMDTLTRK